MRIKETVDRILGGIVATSIVVPILTGLWFRRFGQRAIDLTHTDRAGSGLRVHPVD